MNIRYCVDGGESGCPPRFPEAAVQLASRSEVVKSTIPSILVIFIIFITIIFASSPSWSPVTRTMWTHYFFLNRTAPAPLSLISRSSRSSFCFVSSSWWSGLGHFLQRHATTFNLRCPPGLQRRCEGRLPCPRRPQAGQQLLPGCCCCSLWFMVFIPLQGNGEWQLKGHSFKRSGWSISTSEGALLFIFIICNSY